MIQIGVGGAGGRMGRAVVAAIARSEGVAVTAAFEHAAHQAIGRDVGVVAGCGEMGVTINNGDNGGNDDAVFDVLIEFSTPAASVARAAACRSRQCAIVIGTTGIDQTGLAAIDEAARDIPVLLAANTGIGINLCAALVETAASVIGAISDIEIVEAHHRDKVDAPSGSALFLGEAAARALRKDAVGDGVFARHGQIGARKSGTIGYSTIRGGDIVGEHRVMFIGDGERLEIIHRATDRRIFAEGAITAAKWLAGQSPGLYAMRDVLNIKSIDKSQNR